MRYRISAGPLDSRAWYVGHSTATNAPVWSPDKADAYVTPDLPQANAIGVQLRRECAGERLTLTINGESCNVSQIL